MVPAVHLMLLQCCLPCMFWRILKYNLQISVILGECSHQNVCLKVTGRNTLPVSHCSLIWDVMVNLWRSRVNDKHLGWRSMKILMIIHERRTILELRLSIKNVVVVGQTRLKRERIFSLGSILLYPWKKAFGKLPLMSSQVGMLGVCQVNFRTTLHGARHTISLLLTTNLQWLSLIFTKDTAPSKQSKSTCVNNKAIHLNNAQWIQLNPLLQNDIICCVCTVTGIP